MYCIETLKFTEADVGVNLPWAAGFIHVGDHLYMAGGRIANGQLIRNIRRIHSKGKFTELRAMPVVKAAFPIVCEDERRLITVGGYR